MSTVPGTAAVSHVHVWQLTSGRTMATLHVRPNVDEGREPWSSASRWIASRAIQHQTRHSPESTGTRRLTRTSATCNPRQTVWDHSSHGHSEHNHDHDHSRSTVTSGEAVRAGSQFT